MDCPVCRVPMLVVEYKEVEIDLCEDCKGIWFDRDELEYLMSTANADATLMGLRATTRQEISQGGEKPRKCPLCKRKMKKLTVDADPPVVLDKCERHGGYWFDGGELQQVLRATADGEDWRNVFDFLSGLFPDE